MVFMESYMNLPAIPETFRWSHESWGVALRCQPLEAVAPHLFTTRQLALSSGADWRNVAEAIGAREVQTLTPVHGKDVFVAAQPFTAARRPEADVLVATDPNIAIAVRAADCVPILIADPKTGAVAAVHAGWRGTAARAAMAAVEALTREFGSSPADLIGAIGPSIGPCCYEVGSDLVDAFAAAGHERNLVDRWFRTRPTLRLDMWTANRDQLILAGLEERNIHACELCTATHLEWFPSYRKERGNAGRLTGAIRARA
jgi:YfiH family protein